MQTLVMTARNIRHNVVETDNGREIQPEIEAVLTTYEKSMKFVGGSVVNTEDIHTIRFRLSPESAQKFADNLTEWAFEAERESASLEWKESE